MKILLSEIMNEKNAVRKITAPIELACFEMNGVRYEFRKKGSVDLTITNQGNRKVLLNGTAEVSLAAPCDRCLSEVEVIVPIKVDKELDFAQSEEERTENLDETNYISGYDLDVDLLVYDEILIGFPMKVLCKEDCKGICKVCGANLNEGECGCDRTVPDPRMSVIRDIFNNFKEV
ncbi:MAG: DUF177 domain-containing protein [Lachnospiraceae bacterium]|nr:DUF177 domain-containing protein [Lachnospiraceae bacterium]